MTLGREGLLQILRALKIEYGNMGEFASRNLVHKAIYLMDVAGLNLHLGWDYGYAGPFSVHLSNILGMDPKVASVKEVHNEYFPDDEDLKILLTARPALIPSKTFSHGQEQWLNILASFHYLITNNSTLPDTALKFITENEQFPNLTTKDEEAIKSAFLLLRVQQA